MLAIGSSDGQIRLYDNLERELKLIGEKNLKGQAVFALDLKRIKYNNLFVASGHAKG